MHGSPGETWTVDPSVAGLSPSGFFGFFSERELVLANVIPRGSPPLEWLSSPPLVAVVLLAPKGATVSPSQGLYWSVVSCY